MSRSRILLAVLLVLVGASAFAIEKQEPIGEANMLEDGTIVLNLRAETDGAIGHTRFTYRPGDEEYQSIIEHLGGIKAGESKLVPPWPSESQGS
jgi:hypothetical protein